MQKGLYYRAMFKSINYTEKYSYDNHAYAYADGTRRARARRARGRGGGYNRTEARQTKTRPMAAFLLKHLQFRQICFMASLHAEGCPCAFCFELDCIICRYKRKPSVDVLIKSCCRIASAYHVIFQHYKFFFDVIVDRPTIPYGVQVNMKVAVPSEPTFAFTSTNVGAGSLSMYEP